MNPASDYIADRTMPRIIRDIARERGYGIQSYSDDWVIRLSHGDATHWIHGYRFDLNTSANGYNATDKVATSVLLDAVAVPHVPHVFLLDEPNHFPVVIKPLQGVGGVGVVRIDDSQAFRHWKTNTPSGRYAVSPLVDVLTEYRVVVLDEKSLLIYEKTQPSVRDGLRLFNLGRGAVPVVVEDENLATQLEDLASRAVCALGLRLAAADIVSTPTGLLVIEVNDGFGLEHFSRTSEQYAAMTRHVYEQIVSAAFHDM